MEMPLKAGAQGAAADVAIATSPDPKAAGVAGLGSGRIYVRYKTH